MHAVPAGFVDAFGATLGDLRVSGRREFADFPREVRAKR